MTRLKNLKGVEVLSRESQSKIGGGNLAESCDSVCAATVANSDPLSGLVRWACDCVGGANDRR